MAVCTREELKYFFRNGAVPSETDFADLIDSMVLKTESTTQTKSETIVQPVVTKIPEKPIEKKVETETIKEEPVRLNAETSSGSAVDGILETRSLKGTYTDPNVNPDTILADGQWHNILTNLDGLNVFEIVGSVSGHKGEGRYSIIHALALSTYGSSKNKVIHTRAHYGWWWNKLRIRWSGSTFNYTLQIRSIRNYGEGIKIKYNITQLVCE